MSYDTNPYVLMSRAKYLHLNDPRCYNGAYFDAEMMWGGWHVLDRLVDQETATRKLKFWTELNDYAVSHRGEDARREFKIVEQEEVVA